MGDKNGVDQVRGREFRLSNKVVSEEVDLPAGGRALSLRLQKYEVSQRGYELGGSQGSPTSWSIYPNRSTTLPSTIT